MLSFPVGIYAAAGVGSSLLLDSLSVQPDGAYGLRLLRSAYSGACFQVRRSSDNATQDIGFDGSGVADWAALLTFIGANSGYIVQWYDQSGNGNHGGYGVNANQPRIVNAGTIDVLGAVKGIRFNGSSGTSNYMAIKKFAIPSTAWAIIGTYAVDSVSGNTRNVIGSDGGGYQTNGCYLSGNSTNGFTGNLERSGAHVMAQAGVPVASAIENFAVVADASNNVTAYRGNTGGTTQSAVNFSSGAQSYFLLGRYDATGGNQAIEMAGWWFEVLVFASKTLGPTDRGLIYASQKSYYGGP